MRLQVREIKLQIHNQIRHFNGFAAQFGIKAFGVLLHPFQVTCTKIA